RTRMTCRLYILISLLFVGCTAPRRSDAPVPAVAKSRSIESFRFIGPTTTMPQVLASVGSPDRDVGSGIYIYEYRLSDGSRIWIGSADNSHIMYVRAQTLLGRQRFCMSRGKSHDA